MTQPVPLGPTRLLRREVIAELRRATSPSHPDRWSKKGVLAPVHGSHHILLVTSMRRTLASIPWVRRRATRPHLRLAPPRGEVQDPPGRWDRR